jgi:hypothetical protein
MTLSDWQKNGWVKPHRPTREEIADLLAVAERDLKDARAKGLSGDWRFNIAYNGALQASTAALLASGYAVPKGESSHFRVIQSLPMTIGSDQAEVDRFDVFRKKRSMSIYDAAGVISDGEAKAMREFARELVDEVREWLAANHPNLVPE